MANIIGPSNMPASSSRTDVVVVVDGGWLLSQREYRRAHWAASAVEILRSKKRGGCGPAGRSTAAKRPRSGSASRRCNRLASASTRVRTGRGARSIAPALPTPPTSSCDARSPPAGAWWYAASVAHGRALRRLVALIRHTHHARAEPTSRLATARGLAATTTATTTATSTSTTHMFQAGATVASASTPTTGRHGKPSLRPRICIF